MKLSDIQRVAFAIFISLFFLNAGCSRRQTSVGLGDQEQILHIGNGAEPQGLDPQVTTGVPESHILAALFEGLVAEDPKDLHPIPGVAESWDISGDLKIYTFHLRHNAKWSNGDSVTAHDFVKSYKRMLSPNFAAMYSGMLFVVKNAEAYYNKKVSDFNEVGFKALDDFTLQITLDNPTPYFLSLLNHHSWFPVHIPTVEKYGKMDDQGNNRWTRLGNFVGNGPFILKEWKINQVIAVEKNQTYWDHDKVRLHEIHFHPIESLDTEERSFRSGQLHKTNKIPPTKISVYTKEHPEFLRIDPYLTVYFYRFNVRKPVLENKKVRQALAMAIDRKSIVENITLGGERPAYCLTPPNTAGYTCKAQVPTDFEAAKKLLAEAGYPDGKGFPSIEIVFNTVELHKTIAEAIQQMWKKHLHIDVQLVNQEWKVYQDTLKQMNYQIARSGWVGDYVDPKTFLDMFITDGGNNRTGWSKLEYDRLLTETDQTGDPQKRFELFQKAEAILLDEAPIIPIYFNTQAYLIQPSVKGWYPTILDSHPYKHVYLESTGK